MLPLNAKLTELVPWISAAIAILSPFVAYYLHNRAQSKDSNRNQTGRMPTITGGDQDSPFAARTPGTNAPQASASETFTHTQAVNSITVNGKPMSADADLGSVLSEFMGDGQEGLAQKILQAAAHNTSGKPTVFVNGKQVDASNVDFDALMGHAPSDEAGGSIESRLQVLGKLRDEGLISAAEFDAKKADILRAL